MSHDEQRIFRFESQYVLSCLAKNQIGDAEIFKQLQRGRFIYDHAAAQWYRWSGHCWQADKTDHVLSAVQEVVNTYETVLRDVSARANTARLENRQDKDAETLEKAIRSRLTALQTRQRIMDVLSIARAGDDGLSTSGDSWDQNPMLLACRNIVVELETGSLRAGHPDDMIKTCCPVDWAGIDHPAPVWEKFLLEIFDGDQELIDFMQRLFGYCITGKVVEEKYPFLIGAGRNGKTKFVEAIKSCLGDHAGSLPIETIMELKSDTGAGGPRADIMALRDKRLMTSSESDDGKRLKVGKLKALTGGDGISARMPYGRYQVDFLPKHKLILLTNFEPVLPADDFAVWERILKIPFTQRFVDEPKAANERKKDEFIKEKLAAEYPGILAWCVRGCLEWQRIGLRPPDSVRAATANYRSKNDSLSDFIRECCKFSGQIQAKVIYDVYAEFCKDAGVYPLNINKFSVQMREKFDDYMYKRKVFYSGISLIDV